MKRNAPTLAALRAVAVVLLVVSVAACTSTETSRNVAVDRDAISSAAGAATSPGAGTDALPLKAVGMVDKSRSTLSTITPQPAIEELDPLAQSVRVRGGQLAVGTVCVTSNRPLVRLHVDAPAPKPIRPAPAENAFAEWDRKDDYDEKLREWQLADDRRLRRADTAIATFRQELATLLNQPVACRTTDIVGAVDRTLLALEEATPLWPRVQRVAWFASDGLHTADKNQLSVSWPGDVITVLINGAAVHGVLGALTAKSFRFEAVKPAVDFITTYRVEAK